MTAAIAEMLLQSHEGVIHLLPALPDAWSEGKIFGLRAHGGFQVDLRWKKGKLILATVHSARGEPCRISFAGKTVELRIKEGQSTTLDGCLGELVSPRQR